MNSSDEESMIINHVEKTLCSDPEVEFVVLFGSRATDAAGPVSHLDVVVKFSETLSPHERFRKLCFLSGELQRDDAPFVDLSDIESLPIDVAHDAVGGEFLCGDEGALRRVESEVEATFERRRDDIRRRHEDVIDRIAEDGLRG